MQESPTSLCTEELASKRQQMPFKQCLFFFYNCSHLKCLIYSFWLRGTLSFGMCAALLLQHGAYKPWLTCGFSRNGCLHATFQNGRCVTVLCCDFLHEMTGTLVWGSLLREGAGNDNIWWAVFLLQRRCSKFCLEMNYCHFFLATCFVLVPQWVLTVCF